jgi:uncharacterized Zn finger protein
MTQICRFFRWSGEVRSCEGRLQESAMAEAVAQIHPERALAIYRQRLDSLLPQVDPQSYIAAASYLRSMRPVRQSLGRGDEWGAVLAMIREKYRNRPRFMELFDKLRGPDRPRFAEGSTPPVSIPP